LIISLFSFFFVSLSFCSFFGAGENLVHLLWEISPYKRKHGKKKAKMKKDNFRKEKKEGEKKKKEKREREKKEQRKGKDTKKGKKKSR